MPLMKNRRTIMVASLIDEGGGMAVCSRAGSGRSAPQPLGRSRFVAGQIAPGPLLV